MILSPVTLTSEKNINSYLSSIYFDPKHPASYSGAPAVYNSVKKEGKYKITLKQIKKWLADQDSYAVFKPSRKRFPRPKIVVSAKDQMWDCDCLSMKYYTADNKEFSYILVCIDVFTRFLFTKPLKALRGVQVREAYRQIFNFNEEPVTIRTDHGSEFVNKDMKLFFHQRHIKHYLTSNEIKTSHGERVIQTLRMRIARLFRAQNSFNWVDHLQDVTNAYNQTLHRALNSSPDTAMCATGKSELWHWQYKRNDTVTKTGPNKRFNFELGDRVRISYLRDTFHRAYDHSWSDMLYTVTHRRMHQGFQKYKIKEWNNEVISGEFYPEELQKIDMSGGKEPSFKVEHVLESRTVGGKKDTHTEFLVKWLGWNKRYNTWISERQLSDV